MFTSCLFVFSLRRNRHVEISVPPAEYFWMEAIATRARGDAENAVQVPCSLLFISGSRRCLDKHGQLLLATTLDRDPTVPR